MKPTAYEYEGFRLAKRLVFQENQLKRIEIRSKTDEPILDDVYTGKIVNHAPAIKAYFVDFNGYSGLMKSDRSYKVGQVIPVVVVKERREDKGYRVSDRIYFKSEHVIYFPDDHKNRSSLKLSKDRVKELIDRFGHEKGFLFRTATQTSGDDVISTEIETAKKAHQEAVRLSGIRETGRRIHRSEESRTKVEDLSEILEYESLIESHRRPEVILESRTRLTFEKTRLGTTVDFDSYKYPGKASEDYLQMNRLMLPDLLREIETRDIGGMIIVDLISVRTDAERAEILSDLEALLPAYPEITHHGIAALDLLLLTRKTQRQGLMSYSEAELLVERLYLRIRALEDHADFKGLKVHLHPKYFAQAAVLEDLKKTFAFPIEFLYNTNVEDYSVKLDNRID